MMDIFISIGFDTAIKKYVLFTEKNHHDLATDYLVYVMMMLTFIYSKADIMNPYLARYKNGASNLLHNLNYRFDRLIFELKSDFNKIEKRFDEIDNRLDSLAPRVAL